MSEVDTRIGKRVQSYDGYVGTVVMAPSNYFDHRTPASARARIAFVRWDHGGTTPEDKATLNPVTDR